MAYLGAGMHTPFGVYKATYTAHAAATRKLIDDLLAKTDQFDTDQPIGVEFIDDFAAMRRELQACFNVLQGKANVAVGRELRVVLTTACDSIGHFSFTAQNPQGEGMEWLGDPGRLQTVAAVFVLFEDGKAVEQVAISGDDFAIMEQTDHLGGVGSAVLDGAKVLPSIRWALAGGSDAN